MIPVNRRTFIMAAAATITPTFYDVQASDPKRGQKGILVKADQDRFKRRKVVLGGFPIDSKVASQDTGGGLLVVENLNDKKEGPPRHLHYEQEEWFYAVDGEYLVEIGQERFDLNPGDSLLAPRKVPHAWAFKGRGRGRLLIAFQPAGQMESFFNQLAAIEARPDKAVLQRLFKAHGMQITGPPLFSQS